MERCPWCLGNEKMIRYHDEEWGVPIQDDRKQFEFLIMGSVTAYSHLQTCGIVNSHLEKCL